MNLSEKEISYQITNTYATLNVLNEKTQKIWFVCHGMGYLSRYFLRYFSALNPEENYIVAPQAQSKYYLPPKMRHVGASWLTKENTRIEMENVMHYFDQVFQNEALQDKQNLIVLGFSQGVSVSLRYVSKRKIQAQHIIIHSGAIPVELTPEDFMYLNESTQVHLIYGTQDNYLPTEKMEQEILNAKNLFGSKLQIHAFEGKHEMNMGLVKNFI